MSQTRVSAAAGQGGSAKERELRRPVSCSSAQSVSGRGRVGRVSEWPEARSRRRHTKTVIGRVCELLLEDFLPSGVFQAGRTATAAATHPLGAVPRRDRRIRGLARMLSAAGYPLARVQNRPQHLRGRKFHKRRLKVPAARPAANTQEDSKAAIPNLQGEFSLWYGTRILVMTCCTG